MDLLKQTKQLCSLYNIKPARSLGQNFLISENVYNKMIELADLKNDDVVLEVGPGLGFLTAKLAEKVKKVVAVELDDKLANILKTGLIAQGIKNVEVVNEDVLTYLPPLNLPLTKGEKKSGGGRGETKGGGIYKIVANLPYNITSIFLRKFLSAKFKPELMVLLLQKEVAQRIVASPPKMSLLAVSVQFYAKPEIIQIVPANNFWPKPEVDSAIIKISPHPVSPQFCGASLSRSFLAGEGRYDFNNPRTLKVECLTCNKNYLYSGDPAAEIMEYPKVRGKLKGDVKLASFSHEAMSGRKAGLPARAFGSGQWQAGIEGVDVDKEKEFFRLVKIGFSSKRKMLKNNLAAGYKISQIEAENKLKSLNFNPKMRAQEMSAEGWLKLFGEF